MEHFPYYQPDPRLEVALRRVKELEAALRHQRSLTELERRRADALADQVRVAWRVAATPARVR